MEGGSGEQKLQEKTPASGKSTALDLTLPANLLAPGERSVLSYCRQQQPLSRQLHTTTSCSQSRASTRKSSVKRPSTADLHSQLHVNAMITITQFHSFRPVMPCSH